MKLSTVIFASTMLVAPAIAFAQSQPAPANQGGQDVSKTTGMPTDQGTGNETGNTKAKPADTMRSGSKMKSGTTGMKSGTSGAASGSTMSGPTTGNQAQTGNKPDPEAKKK
jgi:hypothetical protein